ncbi:TetR/AcrR family transcriptional regulator [Nocardioides speluncae]|uniref:TetR/AcrR family transcriptional regulator n=1 Tax=Nocardioides speluncae TaxID=2670337 RepID=UPI000D699F74|nr:TetR/AcrR family transcriptional regulator [Nocardioides speluncae]
MLGTPSRDRIAERREATRREILDAAWAVAHEKGIAALTLKDVAERVGMRPPSLYSHFASKNAIYDAMFGQAWTGCLEAMTDAASRMPAEPRARLLWMSHAYFEYAVADLARNQLMNVRISADFEPSPEAYAPSVATFEQARRTMAEIGIRDDADLDLFSALIGGLVDAQLANDPGGDRYSRLLDRAVGMFADHLGL